MCYEFSDPAFWCKFSFMIISLWTFFAKCVPISIITFFAASVGYSALKIISCIVLLDACFDSQFLLKRISGHFFNIILNQDFIWELCFIELSKNNVSSKIASGNNRLITNEVLIVLLNECDILLIVS